MKRRQSRIWFVGLGGILVAVVAGALLLWYGGPGWDLSLLRLLPPEADLYLVADVRALQSNPAVRRMLADPPQWARDAGYEQFVQEAGFRYQQDLRQVAWAVFGSEGVGSARVALDRAKLLRYLESQSAPKTEQEGRVVYSFGTSRPFRLVLLDRDLVAFSVGGDATRIGQVLGRYLKRSEDSGASELQRNGHLPHVPAGSDLWAVGRMERFLRDDRAPPRWGSFRLGKEMLRGSRTLFVSVASSPIGLRFQVEDSCDSAASAERIANVLRALLNILRTAPPKQPSASGDNLAILLSGLSVQQAQESVLLEWQWNDKMLGLLRRNQLQE